jgi:hypothetical protein
VLCRLAGAPRYSGICLVGTLWFSEESRPLDNEASQLTPYTFSRWRCPECGIFERGHRTIDGFPAPLCPVCGRAAGFMCAIEAYTKRDLPFFTKPQQPSEQFLGSIVHVSGGKQRNGKSTGRPRLDKPVETQPRPPEPRLPGTPRKRSKSKKKVAA